MIPLRDDGAHLDYFNNDYMSKRDFTSAIKAIYIGPNFDKLVEYDKYMDAILRKWKNKNIPVYRIRFEEGKLIKHLC